ALPLAAHFFQKDAQHYGILKIADEHLSGEWAEPIVVNCNETARGRSEFLREPKCWRLEIFFLSVILLRRGIAGGITVVSAGLKMIQFARADPVAFVVGGEQILVGAVEAQAIRRP